MVTGIFSEFDNPKQLSQWVKDRDVENISLPQTGSDKTDLEAAIESHLGKTRAEYPKVCSAIETNGQTLEDTWEYPVGCIAEYLVSKSKREREDSDSDGSGSSHGEEGE